MAWKSGGKTKVLSSWRMEEWEVDFYFLPFSVESWELSLLVTLAVLWCWFSACMYDFLCGHESFHSEYEFSKNGILEELNNKGIAFSIEGF